MTPAEVRAVALSFPDTAEGTSYGYPSIKAAGKVFTRIRADDDSVVVYVESLDHRDMLVEAEPATFHFTDHYHGYPIVLARVASVDPVWLRRALETRWRRLVTKRAARPYDEGRPDG